MVPRMETNNVLWLKKPIHLLSPVTRGSRVGHAAVSWVGSGVDILKSRFEFRLGWC